MQDVVDSYTNAREVLKHGRNMITWHHILKLYALEPATTHSEIMTSELATSYSETMLTESAASHSETMASECAHVCEVSIDVSSYKSYVL